MRDHWLGLHGLIVGVLWVAAPTSVQARVWPAKPRLASTAPLETTAQAAPPKDEGHDERANETALPAGLPIRHLPLSDRRDVSRGLAELLPGAALTSSGVRLRGGAAANLGHLVDGFRVYRLQPPLPFLQEVEFLMAGYGVGLADLPEGAVVMRTHQPAPGLRADVDVSYERNQARLRGGDELGFGGSGALRQEQRVTTATVAGPTLGNRLFLTGTLSHAVGAQAGRDDPEGIFPSSPEASTRGLRGGLTAMLVLSPRHRLQALALGELGEALNGGPVSVAREAQPARDTRAGMLGLRWSARFNEIVSAHLQLGAEQHRSNLESMFCRQQPDQCEQVPAVVQTFPRSSVSGNSAMLERTRETRWQLGGGVEARLGQGWLRQVLRLSSRVQTGAFARESNIPGGQSTVLMGTVPAQMTNYYSNDPRNALAPAGWTGDTSHSRQVLTAIEDQLALGQRVLVTPGLGLVSTRLTNADQSVRLADTSPVLHLGLGVKVAQDGRTWLRASSSRRVDPGADGALEQMPQAPLTRTCQWDPATSTYSRNCTYGGSTGTRTTVGLSCGPTGYRGDGTPCTSAPTMAQVWEHTLGLRQGLAPWAWFDVDLVYRRVAGLRLDSETNRVWNQAPGASSTLPYRNGRPETIMDFSTASDLFRSYRGGTAGLGVAVRGLRGLAAYTYARQEVGYSYGASNGVPLFGRADDPDEIRHGVRIAGAYVFPWASFAMAYRFDSGRPSVSRTFNPYADDYRARVGINPGTEVNAAAGPPPRLPAQARLDLQARFRPGHWLPFGMDFYVDVINAFGLVEDPAPVAAGGPVQDSWVRLGTELRY